MKINSLLAGTLALVLVAGMASPAFAQVDPMSSSGTPTSIPSTGMSTKLIPQNGGVTCALIDFEGGGDLVPIVFIPNAISDATFSNNIETGIDSDAGGSRFIANEPSPDTEMVLSFGSGPGIMTLATPIDEIRFFHTTISPGTQVTLFDSSNAVITILNLPVTPPGAGDPTGGLFGTWNAISFNDPLGDIKSVEFTGSFNAGRTGYDNLELCKTDSTVGGNLLPVDSTALMLAGAQTNAVWIMSALAVIGSVAFGALYVTSKKN